ncbi:hypothetical protein PENTCL1PPCAC_29208, partial [Pristionchus entomophagus]
GIVRPLFLLLSLLSLTFCMEVIDLVPDRQLSFALTPTSGNIEKRQISVKGPLRLRCKGPSSELSWGFEDGLKLPQGATEIVEDDARVLQFDVFDETMDGLYVCLKSATERKRLRLYFFDDTMPSGFHECSADQKSQCVHAKSCRAAIGSENSSCVCMKDWEGEKCDKPKLPDQKPVVDIIKTGMPILWIFLAILVLVGIIVFVKYHNDDEKSELVPTIDPGEMV